MASPRAGAGRRTRRTQDPAIRRTDVDGVATFYADLPGPLRASLQFRVGQADEQIRQRGVTHLVEHLALTEMGKSPHDYNGTTGRALTSFVVVGTPDEVVAHLRGVCTSLGALPAGRLEHERRVLEAESAQRGRPTLPLWRWGPNGFGLVAYDEIGLPALTIDAVQDWSATHFTAGNAALWLSSPPPRDLALPLATGTHRPLTVDPHAAVVPLPGWAPARGGATALSYLTSRTAAGLMLGAVLSRRFTQRLRHNEGLVYGVDGMVDRLTADLAEHTFVAAGTTGSEVTVAERVCAMLAELREHGVTADELEALVARGGPDDLNEPGAVMSRLDAHAQALLMGREAPSAPQTYIDEVLALTPEDVNGEIPAALETLLLEVPSGTTVRKDVAALVPQWSTEVVTGQVIRPTGRHPARAGTTLVLGKAGVSLVTPQGPITIQYDDIVALTPFSDGSRTVLSREGFVLSLYAEQWWRPGRIASSLDLAPKEVRLPVVQRTAPLYRGSRLRDALASGPAIPWRSRPIRAAAIVTGIFLASLLTNAGGNDGVPPVPTPSFPSIESFGFDPGDLQPGQCLLNGAGDFDRPLVVACAEPHFRQVFARVEVPNLATTDLVRSEAVKRCTPLLPPRAARNTTLQVVADLGIASDGRFIGACEVESAAGDIIEDVLGPTPSGAASG